MQPARFPAPSARCAGLLAAAATFALMPLARAQGNLSDPQILASAEAAAPIAPGCAQPTGPGGLWASGLDYKVSLHDGLVFYPYVGAKLPHQPLRWTTMSVRVGDTELCDPQRNGAPRWRDRHCEFDLGGATECYDLGDRGVEQTFVLAHAPATLGDLVIRGTLATPLQLPQQAFRHGAVRLHLADGRDVIEFGAATAIDANGRRWSMDTAVDGTDLSLRLSAAALAQAKWPLVVDPLLSNVLIEAGASVASADVLHEAMSATNLQGRTWIGYSRLVAVDDHDVFVVRTGSNFGTTPTLVHREISTWDAEDPRLAAATGTGDVVTVYSTSPAGGSTSRAVALHKHAVTSMTLDSLFRLPFGSGTGMFQDWRPSIGSSSANGNEVLVVFQRDITMPFVNTATSAVYAGVFDTLANNPTGPALVVRNRPNRDQERPVVNQNATGTQWVVAFQEYDGTVVNDDWDIVVYQVDDALTMTNTGIDVDQAATATLHKLGAHIDGTNGRYCMTYTTQVFQLPTPKPDDVAGEKLYSQRFDVDHATGTGTLPWPVVQLASTPQPRLIAGGLAFDDISTSHWCGAYKNTLFDTLNVFKLGYRGMRTEGAGVGVIAPMSPTNANIAFNHESRRYLLAFGGNDGSATNNQLMGSIMTYDTVPAPSTFGFSCGSGTFGNVTAMADRQQIGSQGLVFELQNAPEDGIGIIALSLATIVDPLDDIGMNGCTLLVDLNAPNLLGQYFVNITGGVGQLVVDLPEDLPPMHGYAQWGYPATGANALNLQVSNALDLQLGL